MNCLPEVSASLRFLKRLSNPVFTIMISAPDGNAVRILDPVKGWRFI